MSESNTNVSVSNSAKTNAAVNQAEGVAYGDGAPAKAPVTSATTINSLEELRLLDPKLYKLLIGGIMQNMLIDFNRQEQRLEAAMKKLGRDEI